MSFLQMQKFFGLMRPNPTPQLKLNASDLVNKTKAPNSLRFVCISDTHKLTDNLQLPEGDVLIHAGDFSGVGHPADVEKFAKFLKEQKFKYKVVIAGNHDITFDAENYPKMWERFRHPQMYDCEKVKDIIRQCQGVTYLEDQMVEIEGIKIYGSPWQPEFFSWGFNLPRGEPCRKIWKQIPTETDILITHGPPLGYGDLCSSGLRAGCEDLLDEILNRIQPKYHVFGHIHEAYGVSTNGVTTFINASTCDLRYKPVHPPICFDFVIPSRSTNEM